ncbi:MAG: hypothetical protein ACI9DF_003337 [Verrucomicrobiales bacterium]|jgi:hypothetical protein
MKQISYEQWVKNLNEIIDSPAPRRTTMPLRQCEHSLPYRRLERVPAPEVLEEILAALLRLRHSRCAGRLEFEVGVMRHFWMLVMDLVFFDDPNVEGELIPDFKPPTQEVVHRNLTIMRLLADYAFEAVKDQPKKEKKTSQRIRAAFELLEELVRRKELGGLLQETVNYARIMIRQDDNESLPAAITLVDLFYVTREIASPKDFIKELNALEERTQHESVAFAVNNTLVEIGEIDELAALDRMEYFRDGEE